MAYSVQGNASTPACSTTAPLANATGRSASKTLLPPNTVEHESGRTSKNPAPEVVKVVAQKFLNAGIWVGCFTFACLSFATRPLSLIVGTTLGASMVVGNKLQSLISGSESQHQGIFRSVYDRCQFVGDFPLRIAEQGSIYIKNH